MQSARFVDHDVDLGDDRWTLRLCPRWHRASLRVSASASSTAPGLHPPLRLAEAVGHAFEDVSPIIRQAIAKHLGSGTGMAVAMACAEYTNFVPYRLHSRTGLPLQRQDGDLDDPFTKGLRGSYNELEAQKTATLAAVAELDAADTAEPGRPSAEDAALLHALPTSPSTSRRHPRKGSPRP